MKRRYPREEGLISLEEGVTEITYFKRFFRFAHLSLDYLPIDQEEDCLERPDVIVTNGNYALIYEPARFNVKQRKMFRFAVTDYFIHDILPSVGRFISWDHFLHVCDVNKYAAFIRDVTDLSPFHFELARHNPSLGIPFNLREDKYLAKVGTRTDLRGRESMLFAKAYLSTRSQIQKISIAAKKAVEERNS